MDRVIPLKHGVLSNWSSYRRNISFYVWNAICRDDRIICTFCHHGGLTWPSKSVKRHLGRNTSILGVETHNDLQFIKGEDLLSALRPIQARKLVAAWSLKCKFALMFIMWLVICILHKFWQNLKLGTSTVGDNSLRYHQGGIGLAPHNAPSARETPPPLHNWSRSKSADPAHRASLPSVPDGGSCTVHHRGCSGDCTARRPLQEQRRHRLRGTQVQPAAWKADRPLGTFCQDLSEKDSFPVPNTFSRARTMVTQARKDVKACLI